MPEIVTVQEDNRIHIPKEYVERVRLRPGDTVLVGIEGRKIVLIPAKVVPVGA